ncbi:MAG: DoxX family membrane protein [Planctomycetia bacterium]|nr:DoxX family membrane protein [Planctomycetia bacterium]
MIALVLLRVTIGWHFLYQGIWKLQTPAFSSAGFLSQAKGPLAEHFYEMVPDIDGREHLDLDANRQAMKKYADGFAKANRLKDAELAEVEVILEANQDKLAEFLLEDPAAKKPVLKQEFQDHLHKLDRLAEHKKAPTHAIPYEQKRAWDEQMQLRAQAAGWSKQIDAIWQEFKGELADVAKDAKDVARDEPRLDQLDTFVTCTNIAIGVCLIAGLFTRFASLAGALFLLQIVAAQPDWPGLYPHPHPSAGRSLVVNKEFVEMMALVALAFLPVGRWGGLDYFVHNLVVRPLLGRKGTV